MAVWSLLRSSWATWPSRSDSRRAAASSRKRANSVTASAMAVSRQRFRILNSSVLMGASASMARPVIDWQTSP